MKKKIKKLGYGVSIHYSEYNKRYTVYNISDYSPTSGQSIEDKRVSVSKSLKKAIKKYKKKFN
jgi:hypothetical protein